MLSLMNLAQLMVLAILFSSKNSVPWDAITVKLP